MREKITGLFWGENYKRNIAILLIALGLVGGVYYKYFYTTTVTSYEYATVTKKDLQKTVEGSGTVVSLSELTIQQLQNGGKVTAVYVKPGDYVKSGQIVATLDNRQAAIQLAQARASYDKIINGATKESLDISKQSVENAKTSYELTKQTQDLAVASAKRNLLNSSVTPIASLDTRFIPNTPTVSGSYLCDYENEYKIQMITSDLANVTDTNGGSYMVNFSSVPQALGTCGLYLSFDVSKSYSGGEWKITLPNKTATNYAANLHAYNSALQSRDQALINASTSITNATLSFNQTTAGARAEDIASARASLASAQLSYENTIVRAPFAGQIGSVSAAVGQQTNSQAGIATIITKDKIAQISLNEIDIVNVKLGQNVDLSFDAIPGEKFKGSVSQIDTIGISTSNVVSFAVKISIPDADERIKSGMSVTAEIIIEGKENVLTVPSGTIKSEGDKFYVMKLKSGNSISNASSTRNWENGSSTSASSTRGNFAGRKNRTTTVAAADANNEKVYVTLGMTNDIDTEILEGDANTLREGDKVVSKTVSSGAVTTTASAPSAFSLFGGGNRGIGGGGQRTGGNTAR